MVLKLINQKMFKIILSTVLFLAISMSFGIQEVKAYTFTQNYGPDGRMYAQYIPTSYSPGTPMPLMVYLHGAGQDPYSAAYETGLNYLAETMGFIVVYPEQPLEFNNIKSWHWYLPAHQARGAGEPASIVGIVDQVKSNYTINDGKVYVQGISAGGAMSVVMGVTYPDVFTAIGVHAGVEYLAATNITDAEPVGKYGGPDPVNLANIAYAQMGDNARVVPTIVWQGSIDNIVKPINGNQVIAQMAQINDLAYDEQDNNEIDEVADSSVTGYSLGHKYQHYNYKNSANNQVIMERYLVFGMGHAVSGGVFDPDAPNSMLISWAFFNQFTK